MLNTIELNECAAIVKKWRAAGKITVTFTPPTSRTVHPADKLYKKRWYEARRDQFRAQGLNSKGAKPRITKYFDNPILAKLKHNPKLYRRAYNRLDRGRDISDLLALL